MLDQPQAARVGLAIDQQGLAAGGLQPKLDLALGKPRQGDVLAWAALVEDMAVAAALPPASGAAQFQGLGPIEQGDTDLQGLTWGDLGGGQVRVNQAGQPWALTEPLGGNPMEILLGIGVHGLDRRRALLEGRNHRCAEGRRDRNETFGGKAERQGPQAQGQAQQEGWKATGGCICHRQGAQTVQLARSGAQEPPARLPSQSR